MPVARPPRDWMHSAHPRESSDPLANTEAPMINSCITPPFRFIEYRVNPPVPVRLFRYPHMRDVGGNRI